MKESGRRARRGGRPRLAESERGELVELVEENVPGGRIGFDRRREVRGEFQREGAEDAREGLVGEKLAEGGCDGFGRAVLEEAPEFGGLGAAERRRETHAIARGQENGFRDWSGRGERCEKMGFVG